ncbi:MAG: response regulator transcription factor [Nitrospira sp.]|nr:response regulator transcription factor [Nitrospira sp.]MBX3339697.1 response regulator transcription factor [Nitrospira sp.]MCW5779732.1 response regulator transcription factor [Nitrospira sp.]
MQTLPASAEPTAWEDLRRSRVTFSCSGPMLLRAFGVPAQVHEGAGQLLLLIEPAQPTYHALAPHLPPTTPIHLTRREESVTRYLLEGLTNKEIANKLSISEHTVKDHLKRLMKKTRVTTRTAVVSRFLSEHRLLAHLANTTAPSADQDIHDLAV